MLAEIFMLRCEAAARNTQSKHAANEAGARWVSVLPATIELQRKLTTAWNGVRSLLPRTGQRNRLMEG
jgi:hypothetical protein